MSVLLLVASVWATGTGLSSFPDYTAENGLWCHNFYNSHWTNLRGGRTGTYTRHMTKIEDCKAKCDFDVTCAAFVVSSMRKGRRICYTCTVDAKGRYEPMAADRFAGASYSWTHYKKNVQPCVKGPGCLTVTNEIQRSQCRLGDEVCGECEDFHMLVVGDKHTRPEQNTVTCQACDPVDHCETYSNGGECDERGKMKCIMCEEGWHLTDNGECSERQQCYMVDPRIKSDLVRYFHGLRQVMPHCVDHGYGYDVMPDSEPDCHTFASGDLSEVLMGEKHGCWECEMGYEKMPLVGIPGNPKPACQACDMILERKFPDVTLDADRKNPTFDPYNTQLIVRKAMCDQGLLRTVTFEDSGRAIGVAMVTPPASDVFHRDRLLG